MLIARLEGGPYDSAREEVDEAPDEVAAWRCPGCRNVHITPRGVCPPNTPTERYRFWDTDAVGVIYRYGDPDRWPSGGERKVTRPKELEPVGG